LQEISGTTELLRMGFALYDMKRYAEALEVFTRIEESARAEGSKDGQASAFIWQGHMLDLLGRREEAIARHRRVVEMGVESLSQHGQYGLDFADVPYASKRLETAFKRVENNEP
jgi:tetratricopeptide (TPR) repeat protein